MKIYIFLTNTLGGISGAPLYVNNKKKFLEDNGWKVLAFDHTNYDNDSIVLDGLKDYSMNRYYELLFNPSWYKMKKRDTIIAKLLHEIGSADTYVVESHQIVLAKWGELLARKLNCQHIYFHINERGILKNEGTYLFLKYKYQNKDLFFINKKVCTNLFSPYEQIECSDENVWKAGGKNSVEDVFVPEIENIKKTDFNIGYFGRVKPFVPYMLKEISEFGQTHPNIKANLICMGIDELPNQYLKLLNSSNINVHCVGVQSPIPQSFYRKTDVVIATAACASTSYRNKAVTISMNVETNSPLGIMGLTTNEASYSSEKETKSIYGLSKILDYIYNCHDIKNLINFDVKRNSPEENYRLQINNLKAPGSYFDTTTIDDIQNTSYKFQRILVNCSCGYLIYNLKHLFRKICG